ncbi:VOC family protein [Mobilicoccus caccae]|uniref:VOC domain-containing protein n=1 Tax=Mobilicoccus caccae TaxID=1859295 RepID=A0ABQ6IVM8_9MICO|nr:VOC family protein [Mobilicoccus caccae]GMA41338.1 hypothetical protein GCM10025883_33830 [Mobilicoccus caccae]
MNTPQLHHCLRYSDADRALTFLAALGFTERLVVRDEKDPKLVHHAQLQWRDNGGVMLGSVREGDDAKQFRPGTGVCNLVVDSDAAVDETLRRAIDAGAEMAVEPQNPPYGGRSAGVRDFDGNFWNIDSYAGV